MNNTYLPHRKSAFGLRRAAAGRETEVDTDRQRNPRTGMVMVVFGVVVVCVLCSAAFGQPWDGNGVEGDPYQIWTAEDMQAIGADANYWDAHFKLMADIDFDPNLAGGQIFTVAVVAPDTSSSTGFQGTSFTGTFDGNGYKISNLTINGGRNGYIGLFGKIDSGSQVKNLGIENSSVSGFLGSICVSSLVGENWGGDISNCYSTGSVSGDDHVGGLVGRSSHGSIINCYVTGDVNGTCDSSTSVGGLVGYNVYCNISDCYSSGYVNSDSNMVGGLVGENNGGDISNSSSRGVVSGNGEVGGLVGLSGGQISNCYSIGAVIAGGSYVGGLLGDNYGDLRNCYSTGAVIAAGNHVGGLIGRTRYHHMRQCYSTGSVNGGGDCVGGLVGYNGNRDIINCYSTGSVGGNDDVGGLVGKNYQCHIADCYSTGSVSGNDNVGGLMGKNMKYYDGGISRCYSTGHVSGSHEVGGLVGYDIDGFYWKCFWDVNVNPHVSGIGNGSDPDVIGETTANMQTRSTFTDVGWDFVGEVINGTEDVWEICEGTNYPKLVWSIPEADFVCPDGVNFIDYSFFAEHWYETDYGDVNGVELSGDGKVTWEDFGLFAAWWMARDCGGCGGADFTGEEDVDYLDLDVFAGYWLESEYGDCGGAELTGDGAVGLEDLQRFSASWLEGI